MLILVNCAVVVLAISWCWTTYRTLQSPKSSARRVLMYVLGSATVCAFALYLAQTSAAIDWANNMANPSTYISMYAQLGFIGVKGTIIASVFSLVCLSQSHVHAKRGIALLSFLTFLTAVATVLNIVVL